MIKSKQEIKKMIYQININTEQELLLAYLRICSHDDKCRPFISI